jgi:hypothetical protein
LSFRSAARYAVRESTLNSRPEKARCEKVLGSLVATVAGG